MFIMDSKRSGGRIRATKYPPPTRLLRMRLMPKIEETEKLARAIPRTTRRGCKGC